MESPGIRHGSENFRFRNLLRYIDFGPVMTDSRFLILSIPCELPSEICPCLECRSGKKSPPVEGSDV